MVVHINGENEEMSKSFLRHFSRARKAIKTWPKWMQEQARFVSATFPKPPVSESDKKKSK
jgi:hypothetical protein